MVPLDRTNKMGTLQPGPMGSNKKRSFIPWKQGVLHQYPDPGGSLAPLKIAEILSERATASMAPPWVVK